MRPTGYCNWCSGEHVWVSHGGSPCPKVKAIEYHSNGTIKRVEFVAHSGGQDREQVPDLELDGDGQAELGGLRSAVPQEPAHDATNGGSDG